MHGSYSATTPLLTSSSNATLVSLTPTPINEIDNALATPTLIKVPIPAIAIGIASLELRTEQTAIKLAKQL